MTSTEFTAGIGDGNRISSKVLKPPGGGSSDIFGLGNAHAQCNSTNGIVNSSTHSRLFGSSTEAAQVCVNKTNIPDATQKLQSQTKKINVRRNPITGEGIEINLDDENVVNTDCDNNNVKEVEVEQVPCKSVQTSIRVRNPPGGKSSGIF